MERVERRYRSPKEKTLFTISNGMSALVMAANRPDSEKKREAYEKLGHAILNALPGVVTDLYVAPEVLVKRDVNQKLRKEWNLLHVEAYALGLAQQTGKPYETKHEAWMKLNYQKEV